MSIDEWDLRTDIWRNESGVDVKLTHLPTGLTATAHHPRSHVEAKRIALPELHSKINHHYGPLGNDCHISRSGCPDC